MKWLEFWCGSSYGGVWREVARKLVWQLWLGVSVDMLMSRDICGVMLCCDATRLHVVREARQEADTDMIEQILRTCHVLTLCVNIT